MARSSVNCQTSGIRIAHELLLEFLGAKESQKEQHPDRLAKIEAIELKCGREAAKGLSKASGRRD